MASVKRAHQSSSVSGQKYEIKPSYHIGLQTNNVILGFLKPGTFAAIMFSNLQATTFPLPFKSTSKSSHILLVEILNFAEHPSLFFSSLKFTLISLIRIPLHLIGRSW